MQFSSAMRPGNDVDRVENVHLLHDPVHARRCDFIQGVLGMGVVSLLHDPCTPAAMLTVYFCICSTDFDFNPASLVTFRVADVPAEHSMWSGGKSHSDCRFVTRVISCSCSRNLQTSEITRETSDHCPRAR